MQAGEIAVPAFELPNSSLRLLILSLIAGLPCVIVLAWVLDVTPTGVRLTRRLNERLDGSDPTEEVGEEDASTLGRALEMILLGICIPVLAFAVVLLVVSQSSDTPSEPVLRPLPPGTDHALAVLPFHDLSMDVDDAGFFARGMHEDILTHLARVKSLKLISRTSVMAYEDTAKGMDIIGRELGVNLILEGTVRRTPTQVRVTAQLFETQTDVLIWAEQFDADPSDIFAVQSRIAESIAAALEAEFAPRLDSRSRSDTPSVVPAAYDAYLKARDIHRNLDAEDRAALGRARHLYERALQSDESLAVAWLQLAILHSQAYWFGFDLSDRRARLARDSLQQARAANINADQLALAEGILSYYLDHDFGMALLQIKHATRLAPGDAEALFYQGMILRRSGELESALKVQSAALKLDPLNLGYRDEYALTLSLDGQLVKARDELRDILRSDPDRLRARYQKWQLDLELDGDPRRLLDEILASQTDRWRDQHYSMLATVSVLAGRPEAALSIISDRPIRSPDTGFVDYQKAMLAGFGGQLDRKKEDLARSEAKFQSLIRDRPDTMSAVDRRRGEAMFAIQNQEWNEAISLQTTNVEAQPIEQDLIVGTSPLWLLLHAQLTAELIEEAIVTSDRLRSQVALGSILYGGHFVLAHWPEFEAARQKPRWSAYLAQIRPAYGSEWLDPPDGETSGPQ